MKVEETAAVLSFTNALLYGGYLTSLGHCLRWLLFDTEGWKLRPKIPWPTVTLTLLLFILSTGNAAIVLQMTLAAIGDQGASAYNAMYAWSAGVGLAVLLVVDAVLIFRCWLVYFKTWLIIAFPLALWLADLTIAIFSVVLLAPNSPWPSPVDNSTIFNYLFVDNMAFLASEIAINVYVTTAIVIQILRISRWNDRQTSGRLDKISRILAESGSLFTITCIINLLFKALALNVAVFRLTSNIMGCINVNTAAIAFNLVLTRMAKERPHVVMDSKESSHQPIFTTFPFGASIYNTTQDGSITINTDIELQITSRAIRTEDSTY